MFGIGAQEMAIIGLLALVVFGPAKLPRMARELGSFVSKARTYMEEFKSEFAFEEVREDPHRRRENDGGPKQQIPATGRRGLANYRETEADHQPGERGGTRDGDGEVAQERGLEEDRHQEPAVTESLENRPLTQ